MLTGARIEAEVIQDFLGLASPSFSDIADAHYINLIVGTKDAKFMPMGLSMSMNTNSSPAGVLPDLWHRGYADLREAVA